MSLLLEAQNVTKRYPGVAALDGITFTARKGKVAGLLGPNGSGKTTFMRIASGQSSPSSGRVLIEGELPGCKTKSRVSYVPEHNHLYPWMSVEEMTRFFEALFPGFNRQRVEKLMDLMQLKRKTRIKDLSRGTYSRLKLVLGLCWGADLLLLDEPLSGIDPASRDKILEGILKGCNEQGLTIMISTHLVGEVEPLLDQAVFLEEGRVKLQGDCDELRKQFGLSLDQMLRREVV